MLLCILKLRSHNIVVIFDVLMAFKWGGSGGCEEEDEEEDDEEEEDADEEEDEEEEAANVIGSKSRCRCRPKATHVPGGFFLYPATKKNGYWYMK